MNLNAYSIYDDAAKAFATPFFAINDGIAVRMFQSNINSKEENNLSKYPDQFTLFKIGTFNDENGELVQLLPAVSLGNGVTYSEKEKDRNELFDMMSELRSIMRKINI